MKFGIDKCSVLVMKKEKEVGCNGTEMENGEEIDQSGEEGYKFFAISENGNIRTK